MSRPVPVSMNPNPLSVSFLIVPSAIPSVFPQLENSKICTAWSLHIIDTGTGRDLSVRIQNDRTDRIYLGTESGLIVCLRERGQEFPKFHMYPERSPILPEMAPDDPTDTPVEESGEN